VAKQESGFIQLPNMIMRGQFDGVPLDVYEYRILMFIAEKTIGYNKKSDGISLSQFMTYTGISKPRITKTIKQLKEKKLITVRKQQHKNGGDTYSRYSLKGVNDIYTGSKPHLHGGVNDVYTQNTIIQNMRERILFDGDNIFHTLTEHEQEREANAYADYVSMDAKRPEAYKAKIMKQIRRDHTETLEAFQVWYLKKTCAELTTQYGGKSSGEYVIESIYPYTDTKGYANSTEYEKEHLFYVQLKGTSDNEMQVFGADSHQALKVLLDDLIKKGTP